ncbi:MAG: CDP-glucose 4,6-dehydratase [Verrucomicrobia bacterium]|nr:CDP-glucose 4,6-dehydratase [Verrucomicrobiota bacterium]
MSMAGFGGIYRQARVLVTGHTGFKGAWLAQWLLELGAEVTGFGLAPETPDALYEQLGLAGRMTSLLGDVRDPATFEAAVRTAQPDFVFHLAAQALVRRSYAEPLATWDVNVLGTARLLELLRARQRPCTVVCVTSDKCYENREWVHGYRETDRLGGHDPYSSSKAAAELVVSSWRASLLGGADATIRVATARAGNVIGGGDRAEDRIVPDFLRALSAGQPLKVRNPRATRPWQHVLEPLSGYLHLAASLRREPAHATAWNFGPESSSNQPVRALVRELLKHRPGTVEEQPDPQQPHEAGLLHLSIDQARQRLGWRPIWSFERAVAETVGWEAPGDSVQRTVRQISAYVAEAARQQLSWAQP